MKTLARLWEELPEVKYRGSTKTWGDKNTLHSFEIHHSSSSRPIKAWVTHKAGEEEAETNVGFSHLKVGADGTRPSKIDIGHSGMRHVLKQAAKHLPPEVKYLKGLRITGARADRASNDDNDPRAQARVRIRESLGYLLELNPRVSLVSKESDKDNHKYVFKIHHPSLKHPSHAEIHHDGSDMAQVGIYPMHNSDNINALGASGVRHVIKKIKPHLDPRIKKLYGMRVTGARENVSRANPEKLMAYAKIREQAMIKSLGLLLELAASGAKKPAAKPNNGVTITVKTGSGGGAQAAKKPAAKKSPAKKKAGEEKDQLKIMRDLLAHHDQASIYHRQKAAEHAGFEQFHNKSRGQTHLGALNQKAREKHEELRGIYQRMASGYYSLTKPKPKDDKGKPTVAKTKKKAAAAPKKVLQKGPKPAGKKKVKK